MYTTSNNGSHQVIASHVSPPGTQSLRAHSAFESPSSHHRGLFFHTPNSSYLFFVEASKSLFSKDIQGG